MRSRIHFFLAVLFIPMTIAAAESSAFPTPTETAVSHAQAIQDDLTAYIKKEMSKHNVKGLSIALVDGPDVVWIQGFGVADAENAVAATPDTRYMVGALSKVLTALEVMRLADQKKVGLDASIRDYLPEFSIHDRFERHPGRKVTVRALLAHHSGLPSFYLKGMFTRDLPPLADLVTGLKDDYMIAVPQTLFRFSYLDYDLLGRMIEKKRRGPFADAMKEDLLEPLGMESSGFGVTSKDPADLARGYTNGKHMPFVQLRDFPVSGMVSTARDMAKLMQFLFAGKTADGKRFIRRSVLDTMFKPQYPGIPLDFGQQTGLGWMLGGMDLPGSEGIAWHEGSLPSYFSQMTLLYHQKLGVVLLSNTAEAQKLGKAVSLRALKLMLHAKYGIPEELDKTKEETPAEVQVAPAILDALTGPYSSLGHVTPVERDGNHLTIRILDMKFDLIPVGGGLFMPRYNFLFFHFDFPQFMLTFQTVEGRQVAFLKDLAVPVVFEKVEKTGIPKDWDAYLGDYSLDNPDEQVDFKKISLAVEDGYLTAHLKYDGKPFDVKDFNYDLSFLPVSDSEAVVPGLFYTDGGTLKALQKDGQTKLFYSGYWFTKKDSLQKAH